MTAAADVRESWSPTARVERSDTGVFLARLRAALRATGRAIVAGLATENGWLWAYGYIGPPYCHMDYAPRGHTADPWSNSAPDRSTPTRG